MQTEMSRRSPPAISPPLALSPPTAAWSLPAPRGVVRGVGVGLFIVVFLAFARAIKFGFSDFDDVGFVLEADGYRGLGFGNFAWMFSAVRLGHYQPLTYLSYAIDHAFFGLDPRGFHFTNIVIHAANAVLVYVLALRLVQGRTRENDSHERSHSSTLASPHPASLPSIQLVFGAAFGALVYGLHPLRVESVVWITERRDVLSGFFLLLAALAYLRAFPVGSVRAASPRWYWASVGLLLASCLSKAWGMTFFAILLALDVYPLRRLPPWPWRWGRGDWRVAAQKIPFLLIGLAAAAMAAHAQRSASFDTVVTLDQWSISDRAVQSAYGLVYYLRKTLWPTDLAVFCELPRSVNPFASQYIAAYAAILAGVVTIFFVRIKAPALLLALVCYVIIDSPVLGILQSGQQFVADRYSYLANIGWSIVLGLGAMWLLEKHGRRLALGVCAAVLVALSICTWNQIGHWRTDEQLFAHALESGWDGPRLRRYYGAQLEKKGNKAAAREQYSLSLKLNPKDGESWLYFGNAGRDAGRTPEALSAYDEAIKLLHEPSRALVAKGLLLLRLDKPQDAVAPLRAAIEAIEKEYGTAASVSGRPYLALAGALDLSGDARASREMLLKAEKRNDTREEARGILRAMDEEARTGK